MSGALDRLHAEKDPCVKYDTTRKLWVYLHRVRSVEEFGMAFSFILIWDAGQGEREGGGKRPSCPLLIGARGAKVPFS